MQRNNQMRKTDNNDKRMQDELFFEGLAENDNTKLLKVPMSDIHNHSTQGIKGGRP